MYNFLYPRFISTFFLSLCRQRQHQLWLLREKQAQEEFKRKQARINIEKMREEEERVKYFNY